MPVGSVSAHLAGQTPYLKINGEYSVLYPVPVSSSPEFGLPQDITNKPFLVGQKIEFEIEKDKLPAPPEVVEKTDFTWDFGDGSEKLSGFKATHTYTKPGSYVQIIYAKDESTPEPQLLSSVLINVVPKSDYQMPKAVIYVNDITTDEPLLNPLTFNLAGVLKFDGSKSEPGTARIKSYLWDLGNGEIRDLTTFNLSYPSQINQIFPVLRVTDENGLYSDSFVELKQGDPIENNFIVRASKDSNFLDSSGKILILLGIGMGILLAAIVLFKKMRKKIR